MSYEELMNRWAVVEERIDNGGFDAYQQAAELKEFIETLAAQRRELVEHIIEDCEETADRACGIRRRIVDGEFGEWQS
jgi:hypothetical protein